MDDNRYDSMDNHFHFVRAYILYGHVITGSRMLGFLALESEFNE